MIETIGDRLGVHVSCHVERFRSIRLRASNAVIESPRQATNLCHVFRRNLSQIVVESLEQIVEQQ